MKNTNHVWKRLCLVKAHAEMKEQIYTLFVPECENLNVVDEVLDAMGCPCAYDILTEYAEKHADLLLNDEDKEIAIRHEIDKIFQRYPI